MALTWPTKDPSEVLSYGVNWAVRLDGDTISTSVFTLTTAAGLTIVSQTNDDTTSTLRLSGGTDGETAEVLCTIVTLAGGDTLEETVFLPIVSSADTTEVPATATKGQIVQMIYEEVGLAGFEFDESAAEVASLLRRVDAVMAELKVSGCDLGYLFPASVGTSDPSDASGLPDSMLNAVVTYGALRFAPLLGKTLSTESRVSAAMALTAMRAYAAVIPTRVLPLSTARGAGSKPRGVWWPFIQEAGAT